jgi:hypothetical protein
MRVPVAAAEQIGGEIYLRFVMDAPLLLSTDTGGPAEDASADRSPDERVNLWTARVERPVAVGDVVELAVAPGRMHLFDPLTGVSIAR